MKKFNPVSRLVVYRTNAAAVRQPVGVLAQNYQGVYFQYDADYLATQQSLAPFTLKFDASVQLAPKRPHHGLHGLFADSLPDGWGMLLMDRVFRQSGVLPQQLTAMDRLAYIHDRAMGALSFEPNLADLTPDTQQHLDLFALGQSAQAVFSGQSDQVLGQLAAAGSSGGARPKALIYRCPTQLDLISTQAHPDWQPWLVKFTAAQLPLGHVEGRCEAAYLQMAARAGIDVPVWELIDAASSSQTGQIDQTWLALKRFDRTVGGGRIHMQSACALLDADFRQPSLDYEDLIKAGSLLCRQPAVGAQIFRRAMFNLFACNQDDHSKNWAFLCNDQGQWSPAPHYDVTFSPLPHGEHMTAFAGFGQKPPLKTIQKLAAHANLSWPQAQKVIAEVVDAVQHWQTVAPTVGVSTATIKMIQQTLDRVAAENVVLYRG